jgi:PAS domain S-box-containing protein
MFSRVESPQKSTADSRTASGARSSGLFTMIVPILVLTASTTLITSVAVGFGWYTRQMMVIVVVSAGLTLLLMAVLIGMGSSLKRREALEFHAIEDRLASIVETAMDAIIAMDESHTVILFNNAAERIFGRSRESVIGQKLEILLPERFRSVHPHHVAHFATTGVTTRRMGGQSVLQGLRANGEEFPIDASISQQGEPGHKVFTVILRDVTLRVQGEQALERSREEIRQLAEISQAAREQERSRVARELHDEIGGSLTALKMDTAWISERLPQNESEIAAKLTIMRNLLDNTVTATRRISSDLRPMMLDDLGLVPATEWLAHDFQRRTGIACELAVASPDIELTGDQATALYRILQESLNNIIKHAAATLVEIVLEIEAGTLILTVRDNGRGFDTAGPRGARSFGLIGMRERVYLLDGQLKIDSTPENGTVVEVRIPLSRSEDSK